MSNVIDLALPTTKKYPRIFAIVRYIEWERGIQHWPYIIRCVVRWELESIWMCDGISSIRDIQMAGTK